MNSPTLQVHTYARISESDTPWSIVICRETARRIGCERWELLRLIYAEGLTQREAAEQLRLDPATIRREVARALQMMAAVIDTEVRDSRTSPAQDNICPRPR